MMSSKVLAVFAVATSLALIGCATTLPEDDFEAGEGDDYIEELDAEFDNPDLDDGYDFEAEYSLSGDIVPIRQGDYRNTMFDGHGCSRSLSSGGCAIAAHAMLMDYYGQSRSLPAHSSALHRGRPHGHSGCLMTWSGGLAPGVSYSGAGSASLSSIRSSLDAGEPIIAHVSRSTSRRCHHFVLVTGYSNDGTSRADFEIMDSATGSRRNLSSYAKVCSTRVFDGN